MDENNPDNQGAFDKEKIDQLEKEIKNIGNDQSQAAPTAQIPSVEPSPLTQVGQAGIPTEVKPEGLKKSKVLLWVGIVLLLLSLVGIGGYYLGSNKIAGISRPAVSPIPTPTPISDPTEGWNTYIDPSGYFTLKYPDNAGVSSSKPLTDKDFRLFIRTEILGRIEDGPLGFSKENATKDAESLKNGEYGERVGASLEASEKVIDIDGTKAKIYMSTWNGGEACSVQAQRSMIVYHNYQRTILSLTVEPDSIKTIIEEAPKYFREDKTICQGYDSWNPDNDGSLSFYQDLTEKNSASKMATEWYDTFDLILSTFKFVE